MTPGDLNQMIVDQLLWPVWKGIPDRYKVKYVRRIWSQFEDNIRSAAYTTNLAKFLDALTLKLDVQIQPQDAGSVAEFLVSADQARTLRALRGEATLLVLLVRARNDERKAQRKERSEADKMAADTLLDGGQPDRIEKEQPAVGKRRRPRATARRTTQKGE